jgi:hypothetical protein
MGSIQRTLAMVLTLALGPAFMPLGCGGSGRGPAVPGQGAAEVPERIALQIRTCGIGHMPHLERADQWISFEVKLANNGEVDSVALRDSTLDDEELEACMASALRELSEDDLSMRRSENLPRGPVAPESRALLGQEEAALGCLASPPCLLTLGFLLGAAYITVQIYVHASSNTDCDRKYQDCINNAPTSCLKRSGGKTQCQRCWERCKVGDPPSGACRNCRF